jgi:hypothetical protein
MELFYSSGLRRYFLGTTFHGKRYQGKKNISRSITYKKALMKTALLPEIESTK